MLLGRVLEKLGDEVFAAETLIGLNDLALIVEIEAAGRPFDETIGEYAAGASRRFAHHASDEDWLALMTALERADDAGAACLRQMLVWSLRHDAEQAEEPDDDSAGGHCTCNGS